MSAPRLYPRCPVGLVDEEDPEFPVYPMSIGAVRHLFEDLAQRHNPEQIGHLVHVIERGLRVSVPSANVCLERLTERRGISVVRLAEVDDREHPA